MQGEDTVLNKQVQERLSEEVTFGQELKHDDVKDVCVIYFWSFVRFKSSEFERGNRRTANKNQRVIMRGGGCARLIVIIILQSVRMSCHHCVYC